jgi:hypothetical protein
MNIQFIASICVVLIAAAVIIYIANRTNVDRAVSSCRGDHAT